MPAGPSAVILQAVLEDAAVCTCLASQQLPCLCMGQLGMIAAAVL